jgi:hypothetical protein
MNKTFEFFSDILNKTLTIEIVIYANEDEAWFDSLEIYDETGLLMSESDLGTSEMRLVNELADEIASDNAQEVYLESRIAQGDALYDQYKDMGMDNAFDHAQDLINSPDEYMVSDENN